MIHLSEVDYQSLREGAEVLEKDGYGDKVLRLNDGNILKLFRIKHLFSSARLFPYSQRFVRNATQLDVLGVKVLKPLSLYRLSERGLDAVLYEPLSGRTIKELCRDAPNKIDVQFVGRLGGFVELLHSKGVYFRSLHLGNIVINKQGDFGLIDVADMRILRRSLNEGLRLRNFSHLIRMKDFCEPVKQHFDCLQEMYIKQFPEASEGFTKKLKLILAAW